MTKAVIIDDEPLAVELIKEYLKDYPDIEVAQIAHDGFDGVKAIQHSQPDLVFLDVEMPKINGFEMLELLENPPAIIFTTAYDHYAVKAFDAMAVDYLLKPFSKKRFAQAMQRFRDGKRSASEQQKETGNGPVSRIVLKVRNEIKIIPIEDVHFLEANDDYVNIHTQEGKYLKNRTLSHFEKTLDASQFIRVHRSYMVNLAEISRLEPYEKDSFRIRLRSGEDIPISKTGLPKLKKALGL
ncbi:LytR/AlgR family response regulator transcription factor [Cecembia calidifontis]|jgi:two-component system LytT family response regulator|uniref:LytTR family two component transcriptional regulator n=1 Tax=Cecembia calidifontis TaxID=1187080 RepID=A0A4V2F6I0_9BACT|nr:LytTR family DNA-binding domain-containing protein [Cecembia calidifontis]RZS96389.1 LytTR family two component transcriptional regulator [Cecembia calidifontis]